MLPHDYQERVYAGVLGKLIGVYVGRPFEGWTHQRILEKLGPIRYYVHEQFGHPLVVTDDDVSGTFAFVRALDEHNAAKPHTLIRAEDIGRSWLNNVVEGRSVFWWGGRGISTEHTAYLNLRAGIPAPHSGSIATNGRTVAEQIGAQIFIDGWAMVAAGNPALAAQLAGAAGSVSHDGESVYAAQLWAAMEAEAFRSADVNHLLDMGLRFVPPDSAVARMVAQVRAWVDADASWTVTRQRIEDVHGYDKYHGCCHVIPNHAIMVMALLYAGDSFHEAMHIINTCGWDTDCNSGNVGCLVALMHGLPAFNGGPDWRGPLADRALISSADGGYSINNAARIALDVASLGFRLAGQTPPTPPKDGAQFHFSLPGSVQGFQVTAGQATVAQRQDNLVISPGADRSDIVTEVLTPTFSPKETKMTGSVYPLMASPLVYPGQTLYAVVRAGDGQDGEPAGPITCHLRLKHYGLEDELVTVDGPSVSLAQGAPAQHVQWTLPDVFDGQPIVQLGLALSPFIAPVFLDRLGWWGTPDTVLRRPDSRPCEYWTRAWVSSVDVFHRFMKSSICIAKNTGEGLIAIGTREWIDYSVTATKFVVTYGGWAGIAVRIRGLRRYYALVFCRDAGGHGRLALVKALDETRHELANVPFDWALDIEYSVVVSVSDAAITARVGSVHLNVVDTSQPGWQSGSIGLVLQDGSVSCDSIRVAAPL